MAKAVASRKDVAQLAGVSETVVSYVINNNRYVKDEKREKVLKAIEELDYRPNRIARALKGKSSKHIILLIDRIKSEYYGELISDIEHFSGDLGYLVSVSLIVNSLNYVNNIIDWNVDGVIISSIHFPEKYIRKLAEAGIPVVLMKNRDFPPMNGVDFINTGLKEGTKKAVDYLYDTGCRRIGYVDRLSQNNHFSTMADFRYRGYYEAVTGRHEPVIISGCTSPEQLQEQLMQVMRSAPLDGIFCRNDGIACAVMNTLLRYRYRIPEDVSIIGMDDTAYAKTSYPTLTTLRQSREEIAKTAIRLIEGVNAGEAIGQEICFEPRLIIRESVREQ
ncbi:MAG: LacI family transcriptional regulator [Lachnospiraceae bacterium]|nr:LacI family transcriptional regulator [Lachnospiraceae bacterium]